MTSILQWCSLHRLAYNVTMDPSCPQCAQQHVSPTPPQYEYLGTVAPAAPEVQLGALVTLAAPAGAPLPSVP